DLPATYPPPTPRSQPHPHTCPVHAPQPVSLVTVPNQRLAAFTRVTLDPGQSTTVHVSFPVSVLAVTPGDIEADSPPAVELGAYQVQVGSQSANFTINR